MTRWHNVQGLLQTLMRVLTAIKPPRHGLEGPFPDSRDQTESRETTRGISEQGCWPPSGMVQCELLEVTYPYLTSRCAWAVAHLRMSDHTRGSRRHPRQQLRKYLPSYRTCTRRCQSTLHVGTPLPSSFPSPLLHSTGGLFDEDDRVKVTEQGTADVNNTHLPT
jgi:hypothetical protein